MRTHEEQVLVITGSGRGIGRATLQLWRERGGVGIGLDLDTGSDRATPVDQGWSLACDVTLEDEVAQALEHVADKCGRIDAVFHNAGVLGPTLDITELTLADWHRVISVHSAGGFLLAKHSVAHMRRGGGGVLLFNASMVARTGSPSNPAYAAAKAALVALTRSLAARLARDRIRVNAISPGSVVGTGLVMDARGHDLTPQERAILLRDIPLGRAATPSDIAEAVSFLASPAARHITGAILPVDGGEWFKMQ